MGKLTKAIGKEKTNDAEMDEGRKRRGHHRWNPDVPQSDVPQFGQELGNLQA
jgi:hypothetical protein